MANWLSIGNSNWKIQVRALVSHTALIFLLIFLRDNFENLISFWLVYRLLLSLLWCGLTNKSFSVILVLALELELAMACEEAHHRKSTICTWNDSPASASIWCSLQCNLENSSVAFISIFATMKSQLSWLVRAIHHQSLMLSALSWVDQSSSETFLWFVLLGLRIPAKLWSDRVRGQRFVP